LTTQRYNQKRRRKKTKREMIKFRNPIENRPEIINNRLENKHFEADLIVSRR
jgi:IS30 family transposase